MAGDNTKRVFPADIFAEDNDKWSWSSPSANVKSNSGGFNYATMQKVAENDSDSSRSSEGEPLVEDPNNVKVIERSFRKRKSSSNSEGNPEDASSSSGPSASLPHERVLPSMYDDDARSASPSAYEQKDLAYVSSFHKEFNPLPPKSIGPEPFTSFEDKALSSEKEVICPSSKDASQSPNTSSKSESKKTKNKRSRSRSKSKEKRPHRSRSRSCGRGMNPRSPVRDRRRSRSKDQHSERDRNHKYGTKRSYSRDSHRSGSHSREYRRRSRSHSKDSRRRSRSHSRDSRRRSRSRGRDYRRSRSRDYRRSRSRSYDRRHNRYRSSSHDRHRHRHHSRSHSRSKDRCKGRAGGAMTPQMALQQTMAAMSAKAEALTGVAFPKYYNPAAVNPLKYAEQVQKRKLLWQKDTEKVDDQSKKTVWNKLQFAQDQDGKMTAKFRKLMGIKSEGAPPEEEKESVLKKQEELFRDLDQQYEMARVTTHTQRGVGLGYSAQAALYPPVQK